MVMATPPVSPSPSKSILSTPAFSGVNICDSKPSDAQFEAAVRLGIRVIRVVPDGWRSSHREFLVGSTDDYSGLVQDDLETLRERLDAAHRAGLGVIISMRSIPGSRWTRGSTTNPDARLWTQQVFQDQAIKFWKDLAAQIGAHPALIALDPLYQPQPLLATRGLSDPASEEFAQVVATTRGSLADSDILYAKIIRAIRTKSLNVPIIVNSIAGGSPYAMRFVRPQTDPGVVYAFRAFEPQSYTNANMNQKRFHYPDKMPSTSAEATPWRRDHLQAVFKDVAVFQQKHKISAHRILVSEYGASRLCGGVVGYFSHLTDIFRQYGWNRLLYCFQSGSKPDYDYELGTLSDSTTRSNNSLWKTIKKDFDGQRQRSQKNASK
jgi:hypothetical protein